MWPLGHASDSQTRLKIDGDRLERHATAPAYAGGNCNPGAAHIG
jgi:hypothetical protein